MYSQNTLVLITSVNYTNNMYMKCMNIPSALPDCLAAFKRIYYTLLFLPSNTSTNPFEYTSNLRTHSRPEIAQITPGRLLFSNVHFFLKISVGGRSGVFFGSDSGISNGQG